MKGGSVARRYARALHELATARGAADETERELTWVAEKLEGEPELRRLLASPLVPVGEKKRIAVEAFSGFLSPLTLDFVLLLLDKKREAYFPAVLREFRRLVDAAANVADVELVLASPADEPFLQEFAQRLQEATGRRVRLRSSVDPGLIGGLVLRIGDRRIDGSLRGRLARLRAFIASAPTTPGGGAR